MWKDTTTGVSSDQIFQRASEEARYLQSLSGKQRYCYSDKVPKKFKTFRAYPLFSGSIVTMPIFLKFEGRARGNARVPKISIAAARLNGTKFKS